MSVALSTIRTRVRSNISNHSMITSSEVTEIIQAEHTTILEDTSWSRRKEDVMINTVGTYTTGTLGTSGVTVTGSGTVWTGFADRYLRVGGGRTFFHRITAVASDTSLTIEAALPADVAAGTSYTIFRHVYDLPSTFGRVLNVTLDTRLVEVARSELDRSDPYRTSTSTRPTAYSLYGLDSIPSGVFQIEFWPVPSSAQAVRVEFLRTNTLTAETDRPLYRADILIWKASESCSFFLHARTGDQSWLALADRYHARYLEALQGAKEEDLGRFGAVGHVRFSDSGVGVGDNFWLDRDPLSLK